MIVKIIQFFLSLSILVILHELGHFCAARWFKTRVEKFYLFFNPGFSLFKIQRGETEYGVGWLPLGGYVKISGMIDESFDTEQMEQEPQPWEFRSKPAWQRLIIMVGGVFVNFVLGVVIFWMLSWSYGESYIENKSLPFGVAVDSTAMLLGLQDGDQILKLGNEEFVEFRGTQISKALVLDDVENITIQRDGREIIISPSKEAMAALAKSMNSGVRLVTPRIPYVIGEVQEDSGAGRAGIEVGDKILSVDDVDAEYAHQFVQQMQLNKAKAVSIKLLRGTEELLLKVNRNDNGKIGVYPYGTDKYVKTGIIEYGFVPAFSRGWHRSIGFLSDQISAFGKIFKGELKAKDSLGSFISIGNMFSSEWDWYQFWSLTAALSLILGFVNLLPIPALDGGYVMFLLVEIITGKKVSDSFMEKANMLGFFLLIGLMFYAIKLDIVRNFF